MKMKSLIFVLFFAVVFVGANELYSTRYDTLHVEDILNSKRLVTNYVECLLNRRPCPPEGKALKRVLPEALRTKCGRCSTKQKEIALVVIKKLYEDYPEEWKELAARWDPTGEYTKRYEEYRRNEQFNNIDDTRRISATISNINNIASEQSQNDIRSDVGRPQAPPVRSVSNSGNNNNINLTPPIPVMVQNRLTTNQPKSSVSTTATIPTTASPAIINTRITQLDSGSQTAASNSNPTVLSNSQTPVVNPTLPTVPTRVPQPEIQTTIRYTTVIRPEPLFRPIAQGVFGIIDNLGSQVAKTASFVTGMLRDTFQKIVG